MNIQIESRQDYLCAIVSGEFSLNGAQQAFVKAMHAAAMASQTRVLIDARGASGAPSQDERYALGVYVADAQRALAERATPIVVRVAALGHPPLVDPQRFGETVAVNRGARVKVTERLEDALSWLGVNAA